DGRVMRRLPIRWKLTGSAFAVTLAIALVLAGVFQRRTRGHLLAHLEDTLDAKADEVQSVLDTSSGPPAIGALFGIETTYRASPYTYFFQITDVHGRVFLRSANLKDTTLSLPRTVPSADASDQVTFETVPGGDVSERIAFETRPGPLPGAAPIR